MSHVSNVSPRRCGKTADVLRKIREAVFQGLTVKAVHVDRDEVIVVAKDVFDRPLKTLVAQAPVQPPAFEPEPRLTGKELDAFIAFKRKDAETTLRIKAEHASKGHDWVVNSVGMTCEKFLSITDRIRELEVALLMACANRRGTQSPTGFAAAHALGIPFPFDMWELAECAVARDLQPSHLWTWWPDAQAVGDILVERRRQIETEGWTSEHDDAYDGYQLLQAALCYYRHALNQARLRADGVPLDWPWATMWWKPKDKRRDLVRAGALCLAERERIKRRTGSSQLSPAHVDLHLAQIVAEISQLDSIEPDSSDAGAAA